jgi:hypothetical protein
MDKEVHRFAVALVTAVKKVAADNKNSILEEVAPLLVKNDDLNQPCDEIMTVVPDVLPTLALSTDRLNGQKEIDERRSSATGKPFPAYRVGNTPANGVGYGVLSVLVESREYRNELNEAAGKGNHAGNHTIATPSH